MESMKHFLETSTIHGLNHISLTTNKFIKLFWILVIFVGFTCAGILIHQSFETWTESPVTTTIETLPIERIRFPKVTVCPPKNTYTHLNYDLVNVENMTIDEERKNELFNLTVNLLQNLSYTEIMKNLSKVQDNDRYYNWYHGYTEITIPYRSHAPFKEHGVYYYFKTFAAHGNVSTKHLGRKYEAEQVDPDINYMFNIYTPHSIRDNENITLHVNLQKLAMDSDVFNFYHYNSNDDRDTENIGISANIFNVAKNFTPPGIRSTLSVTRMISRDNLGADSVSLEKMPGFQISWYFSETVNSADFFIKTKKYRARTKAFIRNSFTLVHTKLAIIIIILTVH